MLKFALGDVPVRVHFSFLLIVIIFPARSAAEYVAWVLVAFLAILLHEAGHAFTARHYGATPVTITLFALGGVTTYPAKPDLTPQRRLLISAMGSIVGIVTGGVLGLFWWAGVFDDANSVVRVAVIGYVWAGLGWGLLNWIPVRPLDGGAMLTSFLEIVWPSRALVVAKGVSVVFGIGASIFFWSVGSRFGAIFILVITALGLNNAGDEGQRQSPTQQPQSRHVADTPDDPPEFPI